MAYQVPGFSYTLTAAADLTGKEGYGIVIDANGQAALAGAGVAIDGVLRYAGKVGETVTIVRDGIMGLVYGGAVVAGAQLATDAAGKFVTAGVGAAKVAVAREAGAANEIHGCVLGYKGTA